MHDLVASYWHALQFSMLASAWTFLSTKWKGSSLSCDQVHTESNKLRDETLIDEATVLRDTVEAARASEGGFRPWW